MPRTYAHRKQLGDWGERQALRLLVTEGLAILDRNWRCPEGEIDIVAADGATLVVCEVKTRSSRRYGTPLEAVTADKANRLHRLGLRWAREHGVSTARIRVDVVAVERTGSGVQVERIAGVA